MTVTLQCTCGNKNLEEIPSGEGSRSYDCPKCGTTIFVQWIRPDEEQEVA